MAPLVMESIEIEGFLSIRSATVPLGRLNLLVGANGAGKSNFVRAFEFLGRLADGDLGFFVGLNGGASALLRDGGDKRIRVAVRTGRGAYEASLVPGSNDELIFESEGIRKVTTAILAGTASRGHQETQLPELRRSPVGRDLLRLLRGCRVFHFHDTGRIAPVKHFGPTADNLALHSDGSNLAAVLLDLRESDDPAKAAAYRRIVGIVQQVAPFFRNFVLKASNRDRIRLRWRQVGSDTVFSANQMSDGTLRFICLATLLLQPELPALVVLDEPELGLHPFAVVQVAELLRQASTRSQVVFATQSVTLMSQFELNDMIVVDRADGCSLFRRPDPEPLVEWLTDYSLGELWEKNLLGGQPQREDKDGDG